MLFVIVGLTPNKYRQADETPQDRHRMEGFRQTTANNGKEPYEKTS